MPLRRVAGERDIAAVGLMHPVKGNVGSFRQLLAGSHQFNAISRSSLLLGEDPDDDRGRVLVRGKGNHSAAPASFEFKIAAKVVELNRTRSRFQASSASSRASERCAICSRAGLPPRFGRRWPTRSSGC